MTKRQSFAIYCKTGYDVRGLQLTNQQIDFILSNYWRDSCEFIREHFPNAKRRSIAPALKGKYLSQEYGLLYSAALKRGEAAFKAHGIIGRPGPVYVKCFKFTSGFGRWLAANFCKGTTKKGHTITVNYGKSKAANFQAAQAIANYLSLHGNIETQIIQ